MINDFTISISTTSSSVISKNFVYNKKTFKRDNSNDADDDDYNTKMTTGKEEDLSESIELGVSVS